MEIEMRRFALADDDFASSADAATAATTAGAATRELKTRSTKLFIPFACSLGGECVWLTGQKLIMNTHRAGAKFSNICAQKLSSLCANCGIFGYGSDYHATLM